MITSAKYCYCRLGVRSLAVLTKLDWSKVKDQVKSRPRDWGWGQSHYPIKTYGNPELYFILCPSQGEGNDDCAEHKQHVTVML